MNLVRILLFVNVIGIDAYWKLEWSDEFDKDHIDQANWEIAEDKEICDVQSIQRLNCWTNSGRNIRLNDGTLALTAIYEKHLNKNYTSAWIKTKKSFTFGRIDIRAALPIGKMLSPWVKLVPPKLKYRDGGVSRQVNVFYNDQSYSIRYGINLGKTIKGNIDDFPTTGSLNEFHTYSLEWNETDIIWEFDGTETNWLNLSKINTFLMHPNILMFSLRVGGNPFRNVGHSLEDVIGWRCSQFILDYVRYYHWVEEDPGNLNHGESQRKSPVASCKRVMDEIRPGKIEESTPDSSINLTAVISGICLLVLLALIPLIVWLVLRMKTIRKPERRNDDHDFYYDDINQMEMYEDIGKNNNYDYADPDKMYDDNTTRNTNYYVSPDPSAPQTTTTTNEQDYITMTAKINTQL